MKRILVEGHQGYYAKYPGNTMISFEAALKLGVDAIEFDVWLTADKVPVLMHDGNTYRICGVDRHLREMTLEEVKTLEPINREVYGGRFVGQGITVPTLEELLRLCAEKRPDLILGMEIKEYTEENVDITVALLKKYGFLTIVISMPLTVGSSSISRPGTTAVPWDIRLFRCWSLRRIPLTITMR
ncbi:MAG: hypothetical protein IJY47_02715 [Clostridia bacterium]|nr:hypothetical protein [Clostridia bacterium]